MIASGLCVLVMFLTCLFFREQAVAVYCASVLTIVISAVVLCYGYSVVRLVWQYASFISGCNGTNWIQITSFIALVLMGYLTFNLTDRDMLLIAAGRIAANSFFLFSLTRLAPRYCKGTRLIPDRDTLNCLSILGRAMGFKVDDSRCSRSE